jgi:hypothetical protein
MHFGLSYNLFGFDLGGVHLNFDEIDVTTLALGSRPRQKGWKVASQEGARESRQEETWESHHILWECKKM